MSKYTVAIVMGSASDAEVMQNTKKVLDEFGVSSEIRVMSAHRTPAPLLKWVSEFEGQGTKVVIAAAGVAAHLAGVVAAHTQLPVIGVPMSGGALNGFDALLSTVQMPKGTPVATVAIGSAGAINAAILAIRILALSDESLQRKLSDYQAKLAQEVLASDKQISGK